MMLRFPRLLLLLTMLIGQQVREAGCAKMLFLVQPNGPSHRRSMYPLARALADKGHRITFFTEMGLEDGAKCNHPNVIDDHVLVNVPDKDFYDHNLHHNSVAVSNFQWLRANNDPLQIDIYWRKVIPFCRLMNEQKPEAMERIVNQHWDLIVADSFFAVCGMGLIKYLQKPYLLFSTTTLSVSDAMTRNAPLPPSYVSPVVALVGHDHRNFWHRMHCVGSFVMDYYMRFDWDRLINEAVQERFPDVQLSLADFYVQSAMSMIDMAPVFDYVRPQQPDTINVAGKCELFDQSLTDVELLRFVESPDSKGTVVLTFGHEIQWLLAPEPVVRAVFDAFARLSDYRILFQYNGRPPIQLANVKIAKWFPLVGLLNHPKTVLHITHGGAKSVTESICTRTPMVVLPLYADQNRNANMVKNIGAGLVLDKFNLSAEIIVDTFKAVMENETYRRTVEKLRGYIVDTVRPPQELAVFWTEYILKRPWAVRFLRHRGRTMNFFVHFCLDILFVAFAAFLVAVVLLNRLIRVVWRIVRRR